MGRIRCVDEACGSLGKPVCWVTKSSNCRSLARAWIKYRFMGVGLQLHPLPLDKNRLAPNRHRPPFSLAHTAALTIGGW
jgi:hypothetical protein